MTPEDDAPDADTAFRAFTAFPRLRTLLLCEVDGGDVVASLDAAGLAYLRVPGSIGVDGVLGTPSLELLVEAGPAPGLLERADGRVLVLDELTRFDPTVLALVLRAVDEGGYRPTHMGAPGAFVPLQLRMVATTTAELVEVPSAIRDLFAIAGRRSASRTPQERVLRSTRLPFVRAQEPALRTPRLGRVAMRTIATTSCAAGIGSVRADLAIADAASALAALDSATDVERDHILRATVLALSHRDQDAPAETPDQTGAPPEEQPDPQESTPPDAHGEEHEEDRASSPPQPPPDASPPPDVEPPDVEPQTEPPSSEEEADGGDANEPATPPETPDDTSPATPGEHHQDDEPGTAPRAAGLSLAPGGTTRWAGSGRRVHGTAVARRGPTLRHVELGRARDRRDVSLIGTLLAAARRGGHDSERSPRVSIDRVDLRYHQRRGTSPYLVLFVVDASGSMAGRRRIDWAREAMLSLLAEAYRERDRVALIAVSDGRAELLLPPGRSTDLAARRLRELKPGGRTALAAGLALAAETLERALRRDPLQVPYIVCVTDGRANYPLEPGAAPVPELLELARRFRIAFQAPGLVVDSEDGFVRLGIARDLAEALGASCRRIDDLAGTAMPAAVRGNDPDQREQRLR